MRICLKYPGAKWRLAEWICSMMPEHHSYLEPFFGSGAVLFNKPRAPIETVNDLDDEVVNLFRLIRDDAWPLSRALELTPYSRTEYERAFEVTSDDPVERARLFLVRCWQSHGFRQNHYKVGWKRDIAGREAAYAARHWAALPDTIMATVCRLRDVQIEHQDAIQLIRAYNQPGVLIYADPPYVLSSRQGKTYRHEMSDGDHRQLLDALLQHKGLVMLSGYDNPMYNEVLAGWYREELGTYASHAHPRTEVLWMNFGAQQKLY